MQNSQRQFNRCFKCLEPPVESHLIQMHLNRSRNDIVNWLWLCDASIPSNDLPNHTSNRISNTIPNHPVNFKVVPWHDSMGRAKVNATYAVYRVIHCRCWVTLRTAFQSVECEILSMPQWNGRWNTLNTRLNDLLNFKGASWCLSMSRSEIGAP